MKTVVLVTNIPAPYRVDLFYYMQTNDEEFCYKVIYTNKNEKNNRQWKVDEKKIMDSVILDSKVIRIKGKNDNRYIHLPFNIGKVLKKLKPDAVIAWEYNPAALQCLVWCKRHKVPFIHLTDGTLYSERSIGKIQKLSRKLIVHNASAYIASSTKAREKLMAYGGEASKIYVSLLTVDGSLFNRGKRKPVPGRLLYVGSLARRKGLDLLISALEKVNANFELHIVGNGTDKQRMALQEMARNRGLEEKIRWLGFKEGEDLAEEYMEASAFVFPTREDCFGLVLLEALYSGVPIVSSKYADGAYDIVEPGINGIIVDPFNGDELAKNIDNILNKKNTQRTHQIWMPQSLRLKMFA